VQCGKYKEIFVTSFRIIDHINITFYALFKAKTGFNWNIRALNACIERMMQQGRRNKLEEAYLTAGKTAADADEAVAPCVRVISP
jgi:hypothetical protein